MPSGHPGSRSPREVLESLESPPGHAPSPETASGRLLLQDWATVVDSLEWALADRYWQTHGLDAFVRSEVPYVINNTSWVAESAASVLLASCEQLESTAPIRALELGAGLGLFARQLLDEVRDACARAGRTEYERLTFYITDGSRRTVERWVEADLFAAHRDHVVLAVCNAEDPRKLTILSGGSDTHDDGPQEWTSGWQAVFANYVFDSLPATVLRRTSSATGSGTHEELRVRTYVSEIHRHEIQNRLGLNFDELPRLVDAATAPVSETRSDTPSTDAARACDQLLLALSYFEFEVDYGPSSTTETVSLAPEITESRADRIVWNYGALASLERILSLLADTGLLLARDLGPADDARTGDLSYVARFGPSLAFTVSFPVLDAFARRRGARSISPEGDADRSIHTRLILKESAREQESDLLRNGDPHYRTEQVFCSLFGDDRHAKADRLSEEATRHINAGRYGDALHCYRDALELCPNDWHLLGHAAQFLTQQMLRPTEAMELVERALEIQPAFSAFLWNTLGNCRFYLGEHEAAHDCYLRARAIHPTDPQTEMNLAYTLTAFGRFDEALQAIARGLAHDRDERFEAALLARQKEIVAAVQKRRQEENERSDRRHQAFSSAK